MHNHVAGPLIPVVQFGVHCAHAERFVITSLSPFMLTA